MKKLLIILTFSFFFFTICKAQVTELYTFDGTDGNSPTGNLILVGNKMYGMTNRGGAHNDGCIFSINKDGSNFKVRFDFDSIHGRYPENTLTYSSGLLFGTTIQGGTDDFGTIFSIDTNGSNMKILHNFLFSLTEAYWPFCGLALSGNVLYGSTQYGGAFSHGVVFSIDTTGNGYKDIHDFNTIDGNGIIGELLIAGSTMYGLCPTGGIFDLGCAFSMDTNGTRFTKFLDFNGGNGNNPRGSFVISGSTLYATTFLGGKDSVGCIFSVDTNGTSYKKIHDFDTLDGFEVSGGISLSGKTLYGVTGGGVNYLGNIYSIDTNGSSFSSLYSFPLVGGSGPFGAPLVSGDTLYGVTIEGTGLDTNGGIYRYVPCNINTYDEPICIVTIDTATNKCRVIWGRTNSPAYSGSYNVYRDSASNFALTHSQPLDSLSEYLDMNSSPAYGIQSYKLSTVDSCGESALSSPHSTIFLTTSAGPNVYILNWTPYVGFTPSEYRIFRGPSLNSMVQIDSVPSGVLTYTDTLPPLGSFYAVEAVNPFFTCMATPKALSHKLHGSSLSGSFSNGYNTKDMGIQAISANITSLKVYPNPNNGMFTLSYSMSAASSIKLSIMDELGRVVYYNAEQKSAGNFTEHLNLEKLAAGIYSLRIQTNGGMTVSKVAIVK
ncbi:MAG TPA: choice-of-anchor tandem repeat GloVer-containing protein [Bacteroidia bacterium]|jgi:uncharacterized repeat protein (TIGR03803 family)|nr:choice-of-anchor tandem repeat GloVer-containing protein [Bacteroidia bacterium]